MRDDLTAARLAALAQTTGWHFDVNDEVTSTNALAKAAAENGAPEGTVILAASQTAGRGRLGRTFCSPPDTGLYMSVVLRPRVEAEKALNITTAAAVAAAQAIEQVAGKTAAIKWVNDIYCDDKKVCGILTEAVPDPQTGGLCYAVLGIGINVREPAGGFPSAIQDIAGAVFDADGGDRAVMAAAVLDAFAPLYAHLEDGAHIAEYRARQWLCGKAVTVHTPTDSRAATALFVDEQCRLVVRYDSGEEAALSTGDVSVRAVTP